MEFDLIKNIPMQVERFFELQQFDLEAPFLESPTVTAARYKETILYPNRINLKSPISSL